MSTSVSIKSKLAAQRIGEYLVTWRKLAGLTAQQVADKAGVTRGTISRLEHGDPSVSFGTVLDVCRAVDALDILTDALDPYNSDLGRARAGQQLPKRVRGRR